MKRFVFILFVSLKIAAMHEVVNEEITTNIPLPPTSFNHLPSELKTIILEYTIAQYIREIRSTLQWEIFDATRKRIKELQLNRACLKIMHDKIITKTILDQLETKIQDEHITCFMGSKVEPPVRLFCMAERLGTRGTLAYARSHSEWKNYFEKIKTFAITTNNPQFKRHINAFVVKLAGGYSVAEYVNLSILKIEDEYINEIRRYYKEDGIRTLNFNEAALKSLDGLQEIQDPQMRRVRINNNFTKSLETPFFSGLANLINVEIKGNKNLKFVDFGIFAALRYLRQMDFSYNGIASCECSKKLETDWLFALDLRHNVITSISLHTAANINAQSIDLFANPLRQITTDEPWDTSRLLEIFLEPEQVAKFKHLCIEGKLSIR